MELDIAVNNILTIEPRFIKVNTCSLLVSLSERASETWWKKFHELWVFKNLEVQINRGYLLSFFINNVPLNCVNNELVNEIYAVIRLVDKIEQHREQTIGRNTEMLMGICNKLNLKPPGEN